jgi:hypothetical protein
MKSLTIASVAFLFILALSTSCTSDDCITGEGSIVTETLDLELFDALTLMGSNNVSIKQGEIQEIKVTGYPNIIKELSRSVRNKHWEIRLKDACYKNADYSVEITIPYLTEANLTGSGNIIVHDFIEQGDQTFRLLGSGNLSLAANSGTEALNVFLTGSGNVTTNADFTNLKSLDINITGSGDFSGFSIQTNTCNIAVLGSGDGYINVRDELDITINGSGNVNYKGNPVITSSITGSGKVIDSN